MNTYGWAFSAMLVVGVVAAVGLADAFGSHGGMPFGGPGTFGNYTNGTNNTYMQAIQNAIKDNSYSEYQTAVTANYDQQVSQDRFNQLESAYQGRQAIAQAIKDDSYSEYTAAMQQYEPGAHVMTQTQFDNLVQHMQAWQTNGNTGSSTPYGPGHFGGFRGHGMHGGWAGNSTNSTSG